MASSPPEVLLRSGDDTSPESSVAFALQELCTCWSQAYEAMTRSDLTVVANLLDTADGLLEAAIGTNEDSPAEARLRSEAASAYGRLQHAMQAGLDGLREEIGKTRRGQKALHGYGKPGIGLGGRVRTSV